MYYKTQNSEEFYFLINFAKSRGVEVGKGSITYQPFYSLLCLQVDGMIVSVPNYGYELITLSEFIKAMEEYKKPLMIGEHKVEFNKGSIKVGCKIITNDTVREIVKNLVD